MKAQEQPKDLATRLAQIDERIVNLDGRLADYFSKQFRSDFALPKIEGLLTNIAGRLTGIEDQLRALRSPDSTPSRSVATARKPR